MSRESVVRYAAVAQVQAQMYSEAAATAEESLRHISTLTSIGGPLPRLRPDWPHCLPRLHQDLAHPCHICTRTRLSGNCAAAGERRAIHVFSKTIEAARVKILGYS